MVAACNFLRMIIHLSPTTFSLGIREKSEQAFVAMNPNLRSLTMSLPGIQPRVEAARERLTKLEAGFRPEEIEEARARLAAAGARVAQLEQQISDATVLSPLAGVVTETTVEQGELVPAGTVLVVVTDLDDAWLTAYVGERDLGRIRLGQEAQVHTDDGQQRAGRLSYISPRPEFTPKNVQTRDEREKLVYEVRIRLDNSDRLFKPGMPAESRLAR